MKKATSFTFYFLFSAAMASMMPFVVLYYQQVGLSGMQIGLLSGVSPLLYLVGIPFWTGLADTTRRHKLIMGFSIAVAVIVGLLFPQLKTFGSIMLLIVLYSFLTAPISSLADSATMFVLRGEKSMYGRVRLGGTIGWGVTALLIGILIQAHGLKMAFWGYAALMSLALIVSQGFSFGKSSGSVSLRSGARTLLSNRCWMLFLAMAFACGIGFTSINNYLLPYMQELGANQTTMGVALSIANLAELPVLYFSSYLIKRLKTRGLLALSMSFTVARLLLYAVTTSPVGVLIVQLINGLTFPIFWVAGVSYADENAPAGMSATAQGLLGAVVFGFGSAVGGLLGGVLLESIGGRSMYLVIGIIVLVSLAILSGIERLQPAKQIN